MGADQNIAGCRSYIEPEQDDIAILDDVFLALGADQALLPGGGHGAAGHQVVVGDHLSPDKAPFEVGVDLAGGLRGLGPLRMVQARHSSSPLVR